MRNAILLVVLVFLNCDQMLGQDEKSVNRSSQIEFRFPNINYFSDLERAASRLSATGSRSGLSQLRAEQLDLQSRLTGLFNRPDLLVPIVAEVLRLNENQVRFWPDGAIRPDESNKQGQNITVGRSSFAGGRGGFNARTDVLFTIYFLPAIAPSDAKSILERYVKRLAPEVRKLTEKAAESFESVIVAAEKVKGEAESGIRDMENRRRGLQIQSYEELPYEKVADHLADLQRQQLAIKLSLVGMEARKNEIERQMDIARDRLKQEVARSQEGAASNEMIEALKQLVKLRAEQADNLKQRFQTGVVTQSDVADATAKVLEARIQLLTLEAKRQPRISSEQLDSLQSEMTRLAIDTSESKARLEYLERLTEEVRKRIARRADLDQEIKGIDQALPQAKAKLINAEQRISELNDSKAAFRPIDLTRTDG